jgi:hypothetical protein
MKFLDLLKENLTIDQDKPILSSFIEEEEEQGEEEGEEGEEEEEQEEEKEEAQEIIDEWDPSIIDGIFQILGLDKDIYNFWPRGDVNFIYTVSSSSTPSQVIN